MFTRLNMKLLNNKHCLDIFANIMHINFLLINFTLKCKSIFSHGHMMFNESFFSKYIPSKIYPFIVKGTKSVHIS